MVAYTYWPMVPGRGTRHPRLLSELLQDNYKVRVITRHVDDPKKRAFTLEEDGNIEIIRIPHLSFKGTGYFARAMTNLSFSLACLLALRYIEKGSIFFSVYPEPPYFVFTAPLVKAIRSCKYLSLITDLLPDTAFDIDIVKNKALRRIVTWFCLKSYRQADRIIVITEAIRKRLIDYGLGNERICVVELAVDTGSFRPIPADLEKIGLSMMKDKFIVLYSGSFGNMYDFDLILESAKEFRRITDKIQFIIRGDGDQKEYIKAKVATLNLENVTLLGPVSGTEAIISFINAASVCVIPIRDSRSIDMTHPSKLLEFWSCGKPVICTTRGESARLIKEFDAGITIDPNDREAFINAVWFLFENPKKLSDMGRNGRKNVMNRFSFNRIRAKLHDQIDVL